MVAVSPCGRIIGNFIIFIILIFFGFSTMNRFSCCTKTKLMDAYYISVH